jgi:hypothetical protein
MKRKFENRIKKLEQIVDPKPYLNPVLIFDPNKPMPPIPPHIRFVLPDNGRKKRPRISEAARKELELMVKQREAEKVEKSKISD